MIIRTPIAVAFFLTLSFCALAIPVVSRFKPVYISGTIKGDAVKKIYFTLNADFRSTDSVCKIEMSLQPDSNGFFQLPIPGMSAPKKINFLVISTAKSDLIMHDYILEPGDSIHIDILLKGNNTNILFSGRGSERYTCRRLLELEEDGLGKKMNQFYSLYGNEKKWRYNDLKELNEIYSRINLKENRILLLFKNQLLPKAYDVLKADASSYLFSYRDLEFFNVLLKNPLLKKDSVSFIYYNFQNKGGYISKDFLHESPVYIEYLTSKAALEVIFSNTRDTNLNFESLFNHIARTCEGYLRDRLIYDLFVNPQAPQIYERMSFRVLEGSQKNYFFDRALSFIKSLEIKKKINEVRNQSMIGSPAYPFSLPDSTGRFYSIGDFKGKVVIMDLWFTGCHGCALFTNKIKEYIKPIFTDTNKLIILSISADLQKSVWLKSLSGNIYTESDNVNVYTDGRGFEDQMIKNYHLSGLPFALLIDKHGMIAENITFLDKDMIIEKIKKLLY